MKNQNKYDQIDFCLNILFDFFYNKNDKVCYKIKPIIKKSITVNTLKKNKNFVYDDIFNEKIDYVGFYNNKWYFKRSSISSYPCLLCIAKYQDNNNNQDDLERGELIDMGYHYLLSEISANDNLQHVMLPIMNFDIEYDDLIKYNIIFQDNIRLEKNKLLYVCIYENYFPMQTLDNYLRENLNQVDLLQWKVIIFQTLFTLYKISEKMRNFRHNNLNLNSIFVIKNKSKDKTKIYKIGNTTFNIPNIGLDIKITNYFESFSTDYYNNKDTSKTSDNPYYDVHYFLENILFLLFENSYDNDELFKFINDIIPEKLRTNERKDFSGLNESLFSLIPVHYLFPSNILKKNNFFSEFIINMDISASPIRDENIQLSRLSEKDKIIDYSFSSPTDISDEPRMLGREINYKKNTYNNSNNNMIKKTYSNNNNMIKGSRKLYRPSLLKEYSISEGDIDIFDRAEKAYNNTLNRTRNEQKRNNNNNIDSYKNRSMSRFNNNDYDEDIGEEIIDDVEVDFKGVYDEEDQRKENEINKYSRNNNRSSGRSNERLNSRSNERSNERSNSRSNERLNNRTNGSEEDEEIEFDDIESDETIINNENEATNRFVSLLKRAEIPVRDVRKYNKNDNNMKRKISQERYKNEKNDTNENLDDTSEISVTPENVEQNFNQLNSGASMPSYGMADNMTNSVLKKLPENYQGQIPDQLLSGMPFPPMNKTYTGSQMNIPSIPMMSGSQSTMPFDQSNTMGSTFGMSNMNQMSNYPMQNNMPQFDIGAVGSAGMRGQPQLPSLDNTMMPGLPQAQMMPGIPQAQMMPGMPNTNMGMGSAMGTNMNPMMGMDYNQNYVPQMGGERVEKNKQKNLKQGPKGNFFF